MDVAKEKPVQGPNRKELTWEEVLTVVIPNKITTGLSPMGRNQYNEMENDNQ